MFQWFKEWWQGYPDNIVTRQINKWIDETNSDAIHWQFVARTETDYSTSFHYRVGEQPKISFVDGYANRGLGYGFTLWINGIQISEAPHRLLKKLSKAISYNRQRQDQQKQEAVIKQFTIEKEQQNGN